MDLTPDSDQQQLVEAVITFLARALPVSRLHGDEAARLPPRRLTAAQGWCAVGLSTEAGGLGLGAVEQMLIARELGRVLAPTHIIHNALAAQLCAGAGLSDLAQAFAEGGKAAALAVADGRIAVGAAALSGPVRLYDCHDADHLLFLDARGAWLLTGTMPPLRPCLDKSVTMAVADLGDFTVVAHVAGPGLRDLFVLLVAAMLQGGAEATRDMINAYAKIRETFGKKIGSYQAVRHPIAEMAARCEQTKALLFFAALSMDEDRSDATAQAMAAFTLSGRAAMANADANIQLHGGIGVTDDFDAHLYLKRANVLTRWCGLTRDHLELIVAAELAPL
ncbi:MAG: acyl-CoA dehydrogenase [Caulobacter sp.]|nr:acyl-CoA dehydrogenase [Caulobacter sp.]